MHAYVSSTEVARFRPCPLCDTNTGPPPVAACCTCIVYSCAPPLLVLVSSCSYHTCHQVDLVRALSRASQQALKFLEKETSTPRKELPPLQWSQLYGSQMSGVSEGGLYSSREAGLYSSRGRCASSPLIPSSA